MLTSRTYENRLARLLAAVCLLGLAIGCGGPEAASNEASEAGAPLPLEYFAGCEEVLEGPTCVLGAGRELSVWLPGRGDIAVAAETGRLRESMPASAGVRAAVRVTAGVSLLQLEQGGARYELRLEQEVRPGALAQARRALDDGDASLALSMLEQLLDGASCDPATRARGLSLRARAKLRAGQLGPALADARRARFWARGAGILSSQVDDALFETYVLSTRTGRLDAARELLEELRADGYPHGKARLAYFRGLIARRAHDTRGALAGFREAIELSLRLGLDDVGRDASDMIAEVLAALGRHDEAEQITWPVGDDPCARRRALNNRAWRKLRPAAERSFAATRQGEDLARDAKRLLEEAAGSPCADPTLARHVWLNAGLAQVVLGETLPANQESARRRHASAAADLLARARSVASVVDPAFEAWMWELAGRLHALEGDAESARLAFTRERHIGETLLSDAVWRAETALGDVALSRGQLQAARAAYLKAEQARFEQTFAVPLGEGRTAFLGERDASFRGLVQAWLKEGDAPRALAALRQGLSRRGGWAAAGTRIEALSSEERRRYEEALGRYALLSAELERATARDWGLADDELRAMQGERHALQRRVLDALDHAMQVLEARAEPHQPAPPGAAELLLAPVRLPDGWTLLASLDGHVRAITLGPEPSRDAPLDAVSAWLLSPLSPELERARRITLVGFEPLPFDIHALPFRGVALGSQLPVRYGLDLPASAAPAEGGALVVADPRGDLHAARAEARRVLGPLAAHGPARLLVGREATRATLVEALTRHGALHYAGHASLGDGGALSAGLELAQGSRLTAGDVLGLGRVPRFVLLSACQAGRESPLAYGLAQAFIARGSEVVIAPTRDVDDDLAARLVRAFYAVNRAFDDPSAALGKAQLQLQREAPGSDWAAFRAYARMR